MAAIVHSVEISRSPEDVFAYVTDLSRFTEWQEGVVRAAVEGDQPMSVGSKTTMTRRVGGRERTMTTEVTEYSPPRRFAFRGIDGEFAGCHTTRDLQHDCFHAGVLREWLTGFRLRALRRHDEIVQRDAANRGRRVRHAD